MKRISHWIGGRPLEGTSGRSAAVFDPAAGEQTAEVDLACAEEVDSAVSAASAAASAWSATSLSARTALMFRLRELLEANRSALAASIVAEHGKVLSDAEGEVARGIENVEFACAIGQHLKGAHSHEVSTGVDVHTILEPLGVVAGITPFNFPVMVPLWMLANAIACGNTFVLKPSERDPSPSLLLAEIARDAGIPDGVVNVVQGDRIAAEALVSHPGVSAISFVGSTAAARSVYQSGTAAGKRVQALGGAKNHMVVLPDADLSLAADAAVSAAFGSAGERCMAVSVVVAVGGCADDLVGQISERVARVVVGPGSDPASQMGPLVSEEHRQRVLSYIDGARVEGASVVVDGRGEPAKGFFVGCTVLDDVVPGMKVYDDEIFGPVLCVARVATYADAVRLVNSNPYGNGVAIYTRDGGVARRFTSEVGVGMVGVNVAIPVPVGFHSFGGWKASLFGDSPIYGPEGVRFYTRPKVVTTRWPDPASSGVDLGFPRTR